jgi:hypothetical protein
VKNTKLIEVMTWWKNIACHLFEIGKAINSQQKVNVAKLKRHVVQYSILWKQMVTWKNPIFWKLHQMMCSYISFVKGTGMSGLANAQGMENKHCMMGKLKFMMSRIIITMRHVSKLSQQQQIMCLSPTIRQKRKLIQDRTSRTGNRGPYKNHGGTLTQRNEDAIDVESSDGERGKEMDCEYVEIDVPSEGHFRADGNTLLLNKFLELCNFKNSRLNRRVLSFFLRAGGRAPTANVTSHRLTPVRLVRTPMYRYRTVP